MLLVASANVLACGKTADSPPVQPVCAVTRAEADQLQAILRDIQDTFRGAYPAAPALTCPILHGLRGELRTESASIHYESFRRANWPAPQAYDDALQYFKRSQDIYALLALSTHWNHDQKIYALKAYQEVLRVRALINTTADVHARMKDEAQVALRFLIHVLESNPLGIEGSENSAIHNIYIETLMKTLDLLTKENEMNDRSRGDRNEQRYAQSLSRWKSHLAEQAGNK